MAPAPELLPFAYRVVLRRAIWPFTALCAFVLMWGILSALDAVSRAFFGTVNGAFGWIPLLGRIVEQGTNSISHKIGSIIGHYASYFEKQAGIRWHSLGQVVSQLAADVEAAALLDWTLAKRVSHFLTQAQIHLLLKGLHAVGKVVTQQTTVIEHRVVRVEKIVGTKANAAVLPKLGRLEGEYEHLIERTIPNLHAAERATADSLARLWHRIRAGEKVLVTTAFAGAVAVALARLGLGWLRCTNVRNLGKRIGCSGFGLLAKLLETFAAYTLATLSILDPELLAKAAVAAVDEVEPLLAQILD